jgi:hypothetical protein
VRKAIDRVAEAIDGLPAPGFVLVLDPATEVLGGLGEIIGVSELLPTGTSSDVEVVLGPALTTSGTLSPSRTWTRIRTARWTGT